MSEYSQDTFYCHATDKKGHCVQVRVALPPTIGDMLASLVASGKIPEYKTPQHVLRDALYHRLKYVNENFDTGIDLSMWTVQIETERMMERERAGEQLVRDLIQLRMHCGAEEKAAVHEKMLAALDSDLPSSAKEQLQRYL